MKNKKKTLTIEVEDSRDMLNNMNPLSEVMPYLSDILKEYAGAYFDKDFDDFDYQYTAIFYEREETDKEFEERIEREKQEKKEASLKAKQEKAERKSKEERMKQYEILKAEFGGVW